MAVTSHRSPGRHAVLALLGALCCAPGCTTATAALQIDLDLPAARVPFRYVAVRAKAGAAYTGADGPTLGATALGAAPKHARFTAELLPRQSVIAPLAVRVRFCAAEDCSDPADAAVTAVVLTIAHPFCGGETTRVSYAFSEIPAVAASGQVALTAEPECPADW